MKKLILILVLISFAFVSCEKDEPVIMARMELANSLDGDAFVVISNDVNNPIRVPGNREVWIDISVGIHTFKVTNVLDTTVRSYIISIKEGTGNKLYIE